MVAASATSLNIFLRMREKPPDEFSWASYISWKWCSTSLSLPLLQKFEDFFGGFTASSTTSWFIVIMFGNAITCWHKPIATKPKPPLCVSNNGKTNQFGKLEFYMLAYSLNLYIHVLYQPLLFTFCRRHVNKEPFPDYSQNLKIGTMLNCSLQHLQ